MAKTTISIEITTPVDMTIVEALRLFTEKFGYSLLATNTVIPVNNGTRADFAKKTIANFVRDSILEQQRIEAQKAIIIKDVQVN